MSSITFFFVFVPILAILLLIVNFIFAPHTPYQEKGSTFECGFHSFLGQNRTQFSISFFIFALLFLLFDLEILLVYPYAVSTSGNDIYGLIIELIFFLLLTLGFAFELGKDALKIDSKQVSNKSSFISDINLYFEILLKAAGIAVKYLEESLNVQSNSIDNIFDSILTIYLNSYNSLCSLNWFWSLDLHWSYDLYCSSFDWAKSSDSIYLLDSNSLIKPINKYIDMFYNTGKLNTIYSDILSYYYNSSSGAINKSFYDYLKDTILDGYLGKNLLRTSVLTTGMGTIYVHMMQIGSNSGGDNGSNNNNNNNYKGKAKAQDDDFDSTNLQDYNNNYEEYRTIYGQLRQDVRSYTLLLNHHYNAVLHDPAVHDNRDILRTIPGQPENVRKVTWDTLSVSQELRNNIVNRIERLAFLRVHLDNILETMVNDKSTKIYIRNFRRHLTIALINIPGNQLDFWSVYDDIHESLINNIGLIFNITGDLNYSTVNIGPTAQRRRRNNPDNEPSSSKRRR